MLYGQQNLSLFRKKAPTIWSFLGVFLLFACNSGSLKESPAGDEDGIKITVISGDSQQTEPQIALTEKIVFEVKDALGAPVEGAKVQFKLLDVTDAPDKSQASLKAAWDQEKVSISPSPEANLPKDQLVGYIMSSDKITSLEGKATVRVHAPSQYGKEIFVLLKIEDEIMGKGFAYTGFKTKEPTEENFELEITTSNNFDEEASIPFSVKIKLLDAKRLANVTFDKAFGLKTTADSTILENPFVDGDFKCEFFNGICTLPGSPFVATGLGNINLTLESEEYGNQSVIISIRGKEAASVQIATSDPEINLEQICPEVLPKDDVENPCLIYSGSTPRFQAYPYLAARDGSFISAVPVSWEVTGPLAEKMRDKNSKSHQDFFPEISGTGLITVTTDSGLTNSFSYYIQPLRPVSMTIKTPNDESEVAGVPFDITILAKDQNGQIAEGFNESIELEFFSKGNEPNWAGYLGTLPQGKYTCEFVSGSCVLPRPEGTEGWVGLNAEKKVVLSVTDSSQMIPDVWSQELEIRFNEPYKIILADGIGGPTKGGKIANVENGIVMSTDHEVFVSAVLTDEYSNYIRDTKAVWQTGSANFATALSSMNSLGITISPIKPVSLAENAKLEVYAEGFSLELPARVYIGAPKYINFKDLPSQWYTGDCKPINFQITDSDGNPTSAGDGRYMIRQASTVTRASIGVRTQATVPTQGVNAWFTVTGPNDAPRFLDILTDIESTANFAALESNDIYVNPLVPRISAFTSGFNANFQGGISDWGVQYCALSKGTSTLAISPMPQNKYIEILEEPFSMDFVRVPLEIEKSETQITVEASEAKFISFRYTRGNKTHLAERWFNVENSLIPGELPEQTRIGNTPDFESLGSKSKWDVAWVANHEDIFIPSATNDLVIEPVLVDGGGYEIGSTTGVFEARYQVVSATLQPKVTS